MKRRKCWANRPLLMVGLEIEHSKPQLLLGDADCRQLGSQITVAVVEVTGGDR